MGIVDWMKRLAATDVKVELAAKPKTAPVTAISSDKPVKPTVLPDARMPQSKLDLMPDLTEADLKAAEVGGLNFVEAIAAHQKWKTRLLSYVEGTSAEKLDYRQICRDNQCVLGKWINGHGGDIYGHMPVFSQLKMVHGQFHLAAALIVQLTDEGNGEQARAALRQDYSKQSVKVQGLISTLYIEVTEAKLNANGKVF